MEAESRTRTDPGLRADPEQTLGPVSYSMDPREGAGRSGRLPAEPRCCCSAPACETSVRR